ncbi:MAG: ankyrin repeat domain-containing protein, partial [Planctomycetota bacterium]
MTSSTPTRRAVLEAALDQMGEGYAPEPPPEPGLGDHVRRIAAIALPAILLVGMWIGSGIYHAQFGIPDDEELVAAVEIRDCRGVERLLSRGADPNADTFAQKMFDYDGDHALRLATENNDTATLRLLLQAGADPNQAAERGGVPLDYAQTGSTTEALLLQYGADPTLKGPTPFFRFGRRMIAAASMAPAGGWPAPRMPLRGESMRRQPWEAARTGDLSTLTWMLDAGTDPNAVGPDDSPIEGKSLLEAAVEGGQPAAVDLLIERGATVPFEALVWATDAAADAIRSDRAVPSGMDVGRDREIVASLIDEGADEDEVSSEAGKAVLQFLQKEEQTLEAFDDLARQLEGLDARSTTDESVSEE